MLDQNSTIKSAIKSLNKNALQIILVVNASKQLVGTLTDGDIRRALIDGKGMDSHVVDVIQNHPKYIDIDNIDVSEIKLLNTFLSISTFPPYLITIRSFLYF